MSVQDVASAYSKGRTDSADVHVGLGADELASSLGIATNGH